jgi:hypothetical protein
MIKRPLTPAVLLLFLFSCQPDHGEKTVALPAADSLNKTAATIKKDSVQPPAEQFVTDNYFHNTTAVLCGETGKANDLNYLFDTLAWTKHAQFIDSSWARLEKNRLGAMKDWGRKEFEQVNNEAATVFYPFSGPDYLTAHAFFPEADTYIMLGLEPVGKLPDLAAFKKGEASGYAGDFKKSLSDIFDKSYFITKKMLSDFQSQKVNGLLPVLSFFIQRSGNELLDVSYLVRYGQDSIGRVGYEYKNEERKPFGVQISFLQAGKKKSVYYFKYDVSNKLFNDTTVFYKYIADRTRNCITYLKSASYLLHAGFMSNMRQLILQNSAAVVQDDTGIPYSYIAKENKFDIKLYGQYSRPVSDFPYLDLQKPLQEAFKKDSASIGKLPFHLGYHWGSKKDIIIFAHRKQNA